MWDAVDCGSVKRVAVDFVSQGTLVVSNCPQISDTRFGVEVRFLLFISLEVKPTIKTIDTPIFEDEKIPY